MSLSLAWGSEALRVLGSLVLVGVYVAMCLAIWRAQRRKRDDAQRAAADFAPPADAGTPWIVAYASQTGTAEQLAWQTARALHAAGLPARICALSDLTLDALAGAERALFVVSTYGEGDPPDNASLFARLMDAPASLPDLRFAVLALGDSEYKHFCGFGRSLDAWLKASGAEPLFDRIDVDNGNVDALQHWQAELERQGIAANAADWKGPAFEGWELMSRRQLNPGTLGGPTFEVELQPMYGQPTWQAGDLVQMLAPADPERAREYSIASLPSEGSLRLLVRQERHPDGKPGVASGWLTEKAPLGAEIQMRLRPNRNFQLGDNAERPLILIGNGTGLAGLRAHLRARAEMVEATLTKSLKPSSTPAPGRTRNWLLFGERSQAHDYYWGDDFENWKRRGVLDRIDLAFSRDTPAKVYVQDLVREQADTLRAWVNDGAAIYICGSLEGMASGVHAALSEALGVDTLDKLVEQGRYRRDVY